MNKHTDDLIDRYHDLEIDHVVYFIQDGFTRFVDDPDEGTYFEVLR